MSTREIFFRRIIVPRGEVMVSSVKCSAVKHNLTEHNFIAINSDSSRECSVRIHDWIVSREAAQVSYISQNKLYQSSKVQ